MRADDVHQELVERAAAGDPVALKVLLTRSRLGIYEFIAGRIPRNGRPPIDAEDIVQATHVSVFQNITALRSTHPASFDRWIKTIALGHLRNTVKLHRRAKRGGSLQPHGEAKGTWEESTFALFNTLAAAGRTPSRSFVRREAITAMEAALNELPLHYQHAVRLTHLEGLSVKEAAQIMGRTERAIHGLCRRALMQLEEQLAVSTGSLSATG